MSSGKLAIHGGPKAVPSLGPYPAKIGARELWEIVDMWEFSGDRKEKLRELILAMKTSPARICSGTITPSQAAWPPLKPPWPNSSA